METQNNYLKESYSSLLEAIEKRFSKITLEDEGKKFRHGPIKRLGLKTGCTIKIAKFERGNEFITEVEINEIMEHHNKKKSILLNKPIRAYLRELRLQSKIKKSPKSKG
jgi:hypothetical protein